MSVDCRWKFNAPQNDVTAALGVLLGCKRTFDEAHGWVKVEGVTIDGSSVSGLDNVIIKPASGLIAPLDANGTGTRSFLWHWEAEHGQRLLMPRSTPGNIAIMRTLARRFGGAFEEHDRGDAAVETYPVPEDVWAGDGEPWYRRQARLAALRPLTADDVERGGY
jgi:hypothetical protein